MRIRNIIGKNKFNFAASSFMKKLLILLLTFAYLASTSGATIYIHQCMGKTIAWDIKENEGSKCTKCGMHKNAPNDCCKDHVKILKVQSDQNLTKISFDRDFIPGLLPQKFDLFADRIVDHFNTNAQSYTPPLGSKTDYCVLYCTFLI